MESPHRFEDQRENGLPDGPREAGTDVHGVGVEIPLKTPIQVGLSAEGPFCRTKRAEMIAALELGVRDRDVQVDLVPEVLDKRYVRPARGVRPRMFAVCGFPDLRQ